MHQDNSYSFIALAIPFLFFFHRDKNMLLCCLRYAFSSIPGSIWIFFFIWLYWLMCVLSTVVSSYRRNFSRNGNLVHKFGDSNITPASRFSGSNMYWTLQNYLQILATLLSWFVIVFSEYLLVLEFISSHSHDKPCCLSPCGYYRCQYFFLASILGYVSYWLTNFYYKCCLYVFI